jgi:hypothetical protein
MSKASWYATPEDARLAASSALSHDGASSPTFHVDTRNVEPQAADAEQQALERVRSTLSRVIDDWNDSAPEGETPDAAPQL